MTKQNISLTFRLSPVLKKCMDESVQAGHHISYSDAIRDALKEYFAGPLKKKLNNQNNINLRGN